MFNFPISYQYTKMYRTIPEDVITGYNFESHFDNGNSEIAKFLSLSHFNNEALRYYKENGNLDGFIRNMAFDIIPFVDVNLNSLITEHIKLVEMYSEKQHDEQYSFKKSRYNVDDEDFPKLQYKDIKPDKRKIKQQELKERTTFSSGFEMSDELEFESDDLDDADYSDKFTPKKASKKLKKKSDQNNKTKQKITADKNKANKKKDNKKNGVSWISDDFMIKKFKLFITEHYETSILPTKFKDIMVDFVEDGKSSNCDFPQCYLGWNYRLVSIINELNIKVEKIPDPNFIGNPRNTGAYHLYVKKRF